MIESTVEEVHNKARLWQSQGKEWHFHALTPGCSFNERSDSYALVLEDRTDNQTYVVYANEKFVKVSQRLVKMLHGDKILDKDKATTDPGSEKMQVVLQRARELNQRNMAWHHHMLFPDCMLNGHKGKWNITFEDKENDKIVELLYDEEPIDDLRLIEVLYFQQSDPSF